MKAVVVFALFVGCSPKPPPVYPDPEPLPDAAWYMRTERLQERREAEDLCDSDETSNGCEMCADDNRNDFCDGTQDESKTEGGEG